MKIINPATEGLIRELEEDSPGTIAAKFTRAKAAQKDWGHAPLNRRLETIRKFRDLVVERKEKLAATLTEEMGKPISQSRGELGAVIGRIDFFLDHAAKELEDEVVLSDPKQKLEERIGHEPLGVIGN